MNKICTSIDQSKKLIELGIDVDTADRCYCPIMDIDSMSNTGFLEIPECYPFSEVKKCKVQYLSAWSLSALLELIPKEQHPELVVNAHYKWICDISKPFSFAYKPTAGDIPLDTAFKMVCWLLENKKI